MSKVTEGEWKYKPGKGRHVTSEDGESVCTMHRGKKAQWNGPMVAAAKDNYDANVALLGAIRKLAQGETVHDLGERVQQAHAAIWKAEGEAG